MNKTKSVVPNIPNIPKVPKPQMAPKQPKSNTPPIKMTQVRRTGRGR